MALGLILNFANGKYLLVEVDGAEETNVKTALNDCKGTSCDVDRKGGNARNDCKGTSCDIERIAENTRNDCKGTSCDVDRAGRIVEKRG